MDIATAKIALAIPNTIISYTDAKYQELIDQMSVHILVDMSMDSGLDRADLTDDDFYEQANTEAFKRGYLTSNPDDAGDVIRLIRYELDSIFL